MALELAEVLRHFGPEYLRQHRLSTVQARAWRAIVACRTPALGGQRPAELMDTPEGQGIVFQLVARMQSGAYS